MPRDSSLHKLTNYEPSSPIHRVSVAIAATFSLAATSLLLIYVVVLVILSNLNIKSQIDVAGYQHPGTDLRGKHENHEDDQRNKAVNSLRRKIWYQNWARHRLSFIKTPFGLMFMNLVLADFIQALGFGMNYFWVANLACHSTSCRTTCTTQGLLIQIGDVASAFSNLMIAIHTFLILTFSWHFPNWITWASLAFVWIPVCVLGVAAPTMMGNWSGPEPFYSWSGDWCWISHQFSPLRLFLHYLWIFISAFASIALYGHLFLRLQIHFRRSKTHRGLGLTGGHCKDGVVHTDLADGSALPVQGDQLRKKLERKARAMLMYPVAFIFLILPLSAYRLASLAGHDWGITAATVCGSMYCLSGFVDVLLFGTTRSILSLPVFSLGIGNAGGTAVFGTNGIGMSTTGLSGAGTRSAAFRVEVVQETVIDLDVPTNPQRKRSECTVNETTADNTEATSSDLITKTQPLGSQSNRVMLTDTNSTANPLLYPTRISNPATINSGSDLENRHQTLFSPDFHLLNHPKPTDPTPWYQPLSFQR